MKIKVDDFSVETSPYTHAGLMITPVISGLDYDVHVYVLDGLLCIKVYNGPEMHPTLDVSFPTQDDGGDKPKKAKAKKPKRKKGVQLDLFTNR